jgi:FixJ family two-component response regulator
MPEFEHKLGQGPWDLVLIDAASDSGGDRHHASMILATGAGVVFLTGHRDLALGVPGLGEWPVVTKPFTSATLLDAVSRGLSLVGRV